MNVLFASTGPHVSLPAELMFSVGPLDIYNSQLLGILGTLTFMGLFWYAARRIQQRRYNRLVILMLWGYEMLLNTVEEVMGDRQRARQLAPMAITLFFVIMINNWFGLLPFVGPVTWHGEPLFRGLASDLNFTAALAIITMVVAQVWAVKTHGFFGNLGRYFGNPFKDPIHAVEGFLELIAEFSRLIALAMRLFGNVFGGEILLLAMAFITSWAASVALAPFMLLELFVGVVQAYVFFMLLVVFVSLASAHHETGDKDVMAAATV